MLHLTKLFVNKSLIIETKEDGVYLTGQGNIYLNSTETQSTNKLSLNFNDGSVHSSTPYDSYIQPLCVQDNTTTVMDDELPNTSFITKTSQCFSTQEYVDKQIWTQHLRINSILSLKPGICESFYNMYQLINAIIGKSSHIKNSSNSKSPNGYEHLCTSADDIKLSMSDLLTLIETSTIVICHSCVWDKTCAPLPIPSTISVPEDGWYFRNFSTTNIIEWTVDTPNIPMNTVLNMYINMLLIRNKKCDVPKICMYINSKATNTTNVIDYTYNKIAPNNANNSTDDEIQLCDYYCLYTDVVPINKINTPTYMQPTHVNTTSFSNAIAAKGKMKKENKKMYLMMAS